VPAQCVTYSDNLSRVLCQGWPALFQHSHSFRNTLVRLGREVCKTPEQFKAWSQNLGHKKALTTYLCYGEVAYQRQGEIIRELATPQRAAPTGADEIAEAVYKKLRSSGVDV
jgi:hypothetical protein